MISIVLDTNVIVSAALTQQGNAAKVLDIVFREEIFQVYYSLEIVAECKSVLSRIKLNIPAEVQTEIMRNIKELGVLINPPVSRMPLPDESDSKFYDAAKATEAILVTGNIKHYPAENFIMTPADFLRSIEMLLFGFET